MEILSYRDNSKTLRICSRQLLPAETKTIGFAKNIASMKEILSKDGVGLAAIQVGWPVALFMLCVDSNCNPSDTTTFINPKIISTSSKKIKKEEGCLSFSDLYLNIERPETVVWSYVDMSFVEHTVESTGFYARAVQHEIDHCNGKVFIDLATPTQKLQVKKWLKM